MRKRDELADPNSCLNKAADDEMIFVLLGRDAAAFRTIGAWIAERVRLGKNREDDPQIREAVECAREMHRQYVDRVTKRLEDQGRQYVECAAKLLDQEERNKT